MRFLLLAACLFMLSCQKPTEVDDLWADAEVISIKDINCGLPVLLFADSVAIRNFTGEASKAFLAHQLPAGMNKLGLQLRVRVTRLPVSETFPCLTLGPAFPQIKLLEAGVK